MADSPGLMDQVSEIRHDALSILLKSESKLSTTEKELIALQSRRASIGAARRRRSTGRAINFTRGTQIAPGDVLVDDETALVAERIERLRTKLLD
jgi:hypothetical protein